MAEFTTTIDVRPRHCDAQAMVHASRYYGYFEEAFLRWLAAVGLDYPTLRAGGQDLVIVQSRCTHHAPARLDDCLDVAVVPTARSRSSLTVEFRLTRDGTPIATGEVVYVTVADGAASPLPAVLAALPTPPSVIDRLHQAQAELYSGGDSTAVADVLADDVVWHVPGDNAIAGTYRGVDEVVA